MQANQNLGDFGTSSYVRAPSKQKVKGEKYQCCRYLVDMHKELLS